MDTLSILFLHLFHNSLEVARPQTEEQFMKVIQHVWDYIDANADFTEEQIKESMVCLGSFFEEMFDELLLMSVKG